MMPFAMVHSAARQEQLSPEELQGLETQSVEFSVEERAQFINGMSAGLAKLHQPIEQGINDKLSEVITNQALLTDLISGEVAKYKNSETDIHYICTTLQQIPVYRNKLILMKKEMINLNKRCSRLGEKAGQLAGIRDRLKARERAEAAKMEQLEARVVTTTPTPARS